METIVESCLNIKVVEVARETRTPEPWATVLTASHYAHQIYVTPENLDLLVQA